MCLFPVFIIMSSTPGENEGKPVTNKANRVRLRGVFFLNLYFFCAALRAGRCVNKTKTIILLSKHNFGYLEKITHSAAFSRLENTQIPRRLIEEKLLSAPEIVGSTELF